MPMRRTIGLSLACLVISTGAIAKSPGKGSPPHPGQLQGKSARAEIRHGKARFLPCGADARARSRQANSNSPSRPKVRPMRMSAPCIRSGKARLAERLGTTGWALVPRAAKFSIGSPRRLLIVRCRSLPTPKSQTSTPAARWSSRSTTAGLIGGVSSSIFRPAPPKRSVSFAAASRPSASNPLSAGERRTARLLQPPRRMLRVPIPR